MINHDDNNNHDDIIIRIMTIIRIMAIIRIMKIIKIILGTGAHVWHTSADLFASVDR